MPFCRGDRTLGGLQTIPLVTYDYDLDLFSMRLNIKAPMQNIRKKRAPKDAKSKKLSMSPRKTFRKTIDMTALNAER